MSGGTTTHDLGVYVHVPFCEHICPYCDFAVEDTGLDPALEREFVDLLLRELELACTAYALELDGRELATVYLGGGTPSLLQPGSVERLLDAKGTISRADIESYRPDREAGYERGAMIREYIARVMRGPQQMMEAMQADDKPVEDLSRELKDL